MKCKVIAVIVVLCLIVLFGAPASVAAGSVCFTAINNRLNPLDNNTMPAIIQNLLYIPSAFFSSEGLGVKSYTSDDQILIYHGLKILLFDTGRNIVVDQDNVRRNIPAIKQNGLIYIPVDEVCNYFELTYQVISSDPAPVVRFVNASDVYTINMFLEANATIMQAYYKAYIGSASPGTMPLKPIEPTFESVSEYLGFYNLDHKNFETLLNTLDLYGFKGCFFVSLDEIAADGELLRRAAGTGHTIGIWLREGTFDEYQKTSSLLLEATRIRSVLVSATEDAEKKAQTTAAVKGLVYWKATRTYDDALDTPLDSMTGNLSVLVGSREGLNFSCSDKSLPIIINFFTYLSAKHYTVQRIVENTAPITLPG